MDVADHMGKPVAVDTFNITEVFPKRVEASIVVAPSIYVSGQGFGVTWRVAYARVAPPQRITAADVFRDEIDEETAKPAPVTAEQRQAMWAEEDQTEQQEEEEVTVPFVEAPSAPAPAPAPAKNRRRVAAAV
jgi:hypothetical protein